jgi:RNA polymerase sigma factor (sigma-70 family)
MDDDQDLAEFCRLRYPALVGSLGLYCGDKWIAEELAQEALVRLWQNWKRVRRLQSPEGWLHRVALNLARSSFRRRQAEARAKARLATITIDAPVKDSVEVLAMRDAVVQLPRRKKTALILRYYLDMSFAEVADVMDVPLPTAKSLARRALEDLRNQLGNSEMEEEMNAI